MQFLILKKFHLITHVSVWSTRAWALTKISFKTHLRKQLKVTFKIVLVKHKIIHYSLYKKYRRLISGFCGTEESRMSIVLRVNSIGSGWSYRWKRIFEDWSNQSWIRDVRTYMTLMLRKKMESFQYNIFRMLLWVQIYLLVQCVLFLLINIMIIILEKVRM